MFMQINEYSLPSSDFAELKAKGNFIDKTYLLDRFSLIGQSHLISRPRGFGKSTFLSMLQCFFERTQEDKTPLFSDTDIWQDEEMKDIAFSFPVIKLDFGSIKGATLEETMIEIAELLKKEYRRHPEIFDDEALNEYYQNNRNRFMNGPIEEMRLSRGLADLVDYLQEVHRNGVILLVDDYDVSFENAYLHGFYEEYASFNMGFFGRVLKGNSQMRLSVLTATVPILNATISSGINNLLLDCLALPSLALGFSKEEAKAYLKQHGQDSQIEEITSYAGGYRIRDQFFLNPGKVNEYSKLGPRVTITPREQRLFDRFRNRPNFLLTLAQAFQNQTYIDSYSWYINYPELSQGRGDFDYYLLTLGYLTFGNKVTPSLYQAQIPNNEARQRLAALAIGEEPLATSIGPAFQSGQGIEEGLKELIQEACKRFNLEGDNIYEHLYLLLSIALGPGFQLEYERYDWYRWADILFAPEGQEETYLLEIKYRKGRVSNNQLKAAAQAAVNRAKKSLAYRSLSNKGTKRFHLLGLAFGNKKSQVQTETLTTL